VEFLSLFIAIISLFLVAMTMPDTSFKTQQKKHARVKAAYSEKESMLKALFSQKKLNYNGFSLVIAAYKTEKVLEVFIKDKNSKKYTLFKSYDFCVLSGTVGPKRRQGDGQVPEGLYAISNFNPQSNFHLSLKVNYPNASDKILSDKENPGGEIYIHGNCVSIGCIPLTDELIKEVYVLAVEARNNGHAIPVYLFPFKMTEVNVAASKLKSEFKLHEALWNDLKNAWDYWEKNYLEIPYSIDGKGSYVIGK
jgi:murein L,D-transpeptidase YafK